MPTAKDWLLPKPADWQAFQRIAADLLQERKRPDAPAQEFGRNGQEQYGVDTALTISRLIHGYQCKCTDGLTIKIVQEEVAKAEKFPLSIKSYTILTTADLDAPLQLEVMRLSESRVAAGKFPVDIVFWQTIHRWLADHPSVRNAHYPELHAEAHDLVSAAARRLAEEFPGTSVEFRGAADRVDVFVRPGPGGIPYEVSLATEEARAKLELSARTGEPLTLTKEEFSLRVPAAVQELFPRGSSPDSLTAWPLANGMTADAVVVVHARSRHHDLAIFSRKARSAQDGFPARMRVERLGSDRVVLTLQMTTMPAAFTVEQSSVPGIGKSGMEAHRTSRAAEPVHRALLAERFFLAIDSDAFLGIVVAGKTVFSADVKRTGVADALLTEALEIFVELADLTGWEINVPERFTAEDVEDARSLVTLFSSGRRKLSTGGGRVTISVTTYEGLENLRTLISRGETPWSAAVGQAGSRVRVLGQDFEMPPTVLKLSSVDLDADQRALIVDAPSLPVRVSFTNVGEVHEELDGAR